MEVLQKAHEVGLMNSHVPEKWGGLGLGCIDAAIMSEELAWGCTGIGTAIEANGLALEPVITGATDAAHREVRRPDDPEARRWRAYAVTEPGAGSDVAGMRSTAVKKGDVRS